MTRNFLIQLLFIILSSIFFGCKKHTSNIIRGKWEMVMIDTSKDGHNYGHRYLIKQTWDFRDFKYVFVKSTLSGQAGAGTGISLDPLPIETEDRRSYEIRTRKKLDIIHDGTPAYIESYIINQLNNKILSMTRIENGKNAGVVELFRIEE